MTKDELNKFEENSRRLRTKREALGYIETQLTKTEKTLSKMPNSKSHLDKQSELLAMRVDLLKEIDSIDKDFRRDTAKFEKWLRGLSTTLEIIFRQRYIHLWTWREIAMMVTYTERHVRRLHDEYKKTLKS